MSDGEAPDRVQRLLEESRREAAELKRSLNRRFEELAVLTRLLKQREQELESARAQLDREREKMKALASNSAPSWRNAFPLRYLAGLVERTRTKVHPQDLELVRASELFDSRWYTETYSDVAGTGIDPAEHYLRYGAAEGRDPGPEFDSAWYMKSNPDVARAGVNPLVHYLRHGRGEGRTPR